MRVLYTYKYWSGVEREMLIRVHHHIKNQSKWGHAHARFYMMLSGFLDWQCSWQQIMVNTVPFAEYKFSRIAATYIHFQRKQYITPMGSKTNTWAWPSWAFWTFCISRILHWCSLYVYVLSCQSLYLPYQLRLIFLLEIELLMQLISLGSSSGR